VKLRAISVLAALAVTSCSKASNGQLTPSEFRDAVATSLSSKRHGLCMEKPDPSTIHVGREGKNCREAILSTAYAYTQYLKDPTQLQPLVDKLASTAAFALDKGGQAPSKPDVDKNRAGGLWRPFVGDLILVLVENDPDKIQSLTAAELKLAGLTEDQAWKRASENLQTQIGPLQRSKNPQGAEIITASSELAPSNLLLADACKSGGANFDAIIVSRDTYLYANQVVQSASASLTSYAEGKLKSGEEIYSESLISCINGRWSASKLFATSTSR
jgi:hypothetical protein